MPNWIEYKIVKNNDLVRFEFEVNRNIRLGYLPQGGISFTAQPNQYVQAMTIDRATAITRDKL